MPKSLRALAIRFVLIVLCSAIIALAGGVSFVLRPVGAIYLTLWIAWLLVVALGRERGARSSYDRTQRTFLALSGIIMLVLLTLPPWEYMHLTDPISGDGPLSWLGLTLFAVGVGIQFAAVRALQGFYTVRLSVQAGHHVITDGPYRFVRHPGYLGHMLCMAGVGLALGSLIALGLTILILPLLLWRIRHEEQMLAVEFAEEYPSYMQRTKRLIPFIY
jgi:protein-S-isoprenylcysteine O-methyltransferase Ste14